MMEQMDILLYSGIVLIAVLLLVIIVQNCSIKKATSGEKLEKLAEAAKEQADAIKGLAESQSKDIFELRALLNSEIVLTRQELLQTMQSSFKSFGDILSTNQKESAENQDKRLAELGRLIGDLNVQMEVRLEHIRRTMELKVTAMQEENGRQLEKMRQTVDEKLQKTLEDRLSQSFKVVSERLEQVYKGLGEMQTLATGVGDLKKVLSNVKTRGILGEIQLGAILEQILSPEQYDENVRTKSSGTEKVEFAIKLPGDEGGSVYLPIDAKFPGDAYSNLVDAYENGNAEAVQLAGKALDAAIKKAAKDINEKYVEPPYTTDFAIMFLPFEGLYAEAVRRGMVETLQKEYKINIAGPTTMAALLNSLQMGFKTLAIQKHSGEVWDILGAVKTEFVNFEKVLLSAQQRINQANSDLDKLIGTRTRSIQRRLRDVTSLPEEESRSVLGISEDTDASEAGSEPLHHVLNVEIGTEFKSESDSDSGLDIGTDDTKAGIFGMNDDGRFISILDKDEE